MTKLLQPRKLLRKTILVMGSGRSGSTWLAGLLASPFRFRLLFEPFHPEHVPGAELVADRYFCPTAVPANVVDFITNAFEDRIDSNWIAQHSNRRLRMHRWRWWPKARIIKIIRGNLLIPAIRSIYGMSLPIVVLMRHPGAVVDSFFRVKFPWAFNISTLLAQSEFFSTYNIPLAYFKEIAIDPVGVIMARWLIENLFLLRHAKRLNCKIVFYEDLVEDPVRQIGDLCESLDIAVYKNLEGKSSKPSVTTHPRSHLHKDDHHINSWRKSLLPESVSQIDEILNAVKLDYPCG